MFTHSGSRKDSFQWKPKRDSTPRVFEGYESGICSKWLWSCFDTLEAKVSRLWNILENKSEEKVQVTEFGGYAHGFTDIIDLKRGANKCCHPHYNLAGYARRDSQLQFIKSIYLTVCDNEQVNLQPIVEEVFSIIFNENLICLSMMPKDSPEFITWLESLPQCKDKDSQEFITWLESLPQCKDKDSQEYTHHTKQQNILDLLASIPSIIIDD